MYMYMYMYVYTCIYKLILKKLGPASQDLASEYTDQTLLFTEPLSRGASY